MSETLGPVGGGPAPTPAGAADGADPAADAALLEEVARELGLVDAALQRLDAGTYGTCEVCGAALDPAALDADPLAGRCAAHAA